MNADYLDAISFQMEAVKSALRSDAGEMLASADTYVWHNEPWTAIEMAAESYPTHVPICSAPLPARPMFWCIGRANGMMGYLIYREHNSLRWSKIGRSLLPAPYDTSRLPVGESIEAFLNGYAAEIESEDLDWTRTILQQILVGLTWIDQHIVTAETEAIERHARKRFCRELGVLTAPQLRIVQLRRLSISDNKDHGDVHWSCRWLVRGHWRHQFHPSTGTYATRFIGPYVKGPAAAPFKAASPTVFAVTR